MSDSSNIVLIGFMASGKSAVGRELARRTNRYFLDSDVLIEAAQGRTISEIFASDGEEAFRQMERETADWLENHVEKAVIATGGGMPTVCPELKKIGFTLFLEIDFDTVLDRLEGKESEKRPLAKELEGLKKRFQERQEIYREAADRIVDGRGTVENVVKRILG